MSATEPGECYIPAAGEVPPPVYIYAQDFVSALIGPFKTKEEAYAHIVFCTGRGDDATMTVIDDPEEIARITEECAPVEVSVEGDLQYDPNG